MSTDFYWKIWLRVLARLERIVNTDIEFQRSKAHDQKRCHAAQRLTGVLGAYYTIYNDAMECLHQNLQVQKTMYIATVIKTVFARILELKQELQKLESRNFQFLGHGLVTHNITTYDTELMELPTKYERPDEVKAGIEEAFRKAIEKKEMLEKLALEEKQKALEEAGKMNVPDLWDEDKDKAQKKDEYTFGEIKKFVDEKALERRRLVQMIQAHEKTRQVTKNINLSKIRREMWEKELFGTVNPQASHEVKERSTKIIQQVCRAHFALKRKKIEECKRDELLGIALCKPLKGDIENANVENQNKRNDLANKYDSEWITLYKVLKQKYFKKRGADIAEDIRDEIRSWFMKWFDEVKFIYDIPSEAKGGSSMVVSEEVLTPLEWQKAYKEYLEKKKSSKGKTALELKYEKQRMEKEAAENKREERMKQLMQDKLMKKIMKNPKMHPGFLYPQSNKTEDIRKAIEDYRAAWGVLDLIGSVEVKEGSIREIDVDNVCMEVKSEVRKAVDEEMRNELKLLKKALRKDYKRNDEQIPDSMIKPSKKKKHKNKVIPTMMGPQVLEKMQDLVFRGVLKEYPQTTFADFLGDHNFAGDDFRCLYTPEPAYGGETRNIWWERAREAMSGLRRILLVGPKESGKTVLVHALASANDAVLFEFDPSEVLDEEELPNYLKDLVKAVASCAKAVQPAVIYIRHVQKLFYIKTPPEEANAKLELKSRYFIKRLFKRLNKRDRVTVIGSCADPWLARGQMLKRFPEVVLVPNTNYTLVVKLLNDWVLNNHTVPRDLDVHSLAHVLQGYSYGFLQRALDNYLSAERIIKIAAFGLSPKDIYDYILQDETNTKIEYDKYREWYTKKTPWGIKEMKQIEEQMEFKAVSDKWEEKMEKRKKKKGAVIEHILKDIVEE